MESADSLVRGRFGHAAWFLLIPFKLSSVGYVIKCDRNILKYAKGFK